MNFIQLDPSGVYVIGYGEAKVLPTGSIAAPAGLKDIVPTELYMVDGQLVPRPTSSTPIQQSGGWRVTALGDATVEVYDTVGNEVMAVEQLGEGEVFEFSLPDPGTYKVIVSEPLPALPSKTIIEVEQ